MKLAIASGKGGTGKTTVAVCIALSADRPVRLLDCDVEEPNCHLFLKPQIQLRKPVTVPVPEVNTDRCSGCGQCRDICQFNAIAVLKRKAVIYPELCHSCGGCALVCPTDAIREIEREIGYVEVGSRDGVMLVTGTLHIGQTLAPTVIRAVKQHAAPEGLTIIDCPPGTACAMVAAVRDADHVLLVTEPTPFGLHDLKLAVATVRKLGLRFSVVLNRVDIGDDRVIEYCRQEGIPVRLQIPDDRRIAEAYSRGEPPLNARPELKVGFQQFLDELGT